MAIERLRLGCGNIFQPHVTNYKDNLTYIEFLMGILKKLNETVDQVNYNTKFIEEFEEKYADLTERIVALENSVATEIPALIESSINSLRIEIQSLISGTVEELKAYSDVHDAYLQDQINNISIGRINVYDPTTGLYSPLQAVINNLAGSSRTDALTADEYDALELTATEFAATQISAYDYDFNGKTILTA